MRCKRGHGDHDENAAYCWKCGARLGDRKRGLEMTEHLALTARLQAIADGDLDDRTISSGEAAYILKTLTEKPAYDLDYHQIVELHQQEIIDRDEARGALGL